MLDRRVHPGATVANEGLVSSSEAFRLRLADSLRPLADPEQIQEHAARVLGETLAATRVIYARFSEGGDARVVSSEWRVDGAASLIGREQLDEYGPTITDALWLGETLVVDDVHTDARLSGAERAKALSTGAAAYVILPLRKGERPVAALAVHQDAPRTWTRLEIELIEDTAERTWAAVERAVAEEALRESEERLRETLRHASAGVFEWNLGAGSFRGSPEFFALYGLEPVERLAYATLAERVHPDDRARLRADMQVAYAGDVPEFEHEFRVVHPDGERWLLGVGRVEFGSDGQPARVRGLNLDITGRKRAEQQLREADRRKTEFLAMLSHELRNPLAPIRTAIELLEAIDKSDPVIARALATLDRQSAHLTRIVDDLLDVTRISRGKIELERRVLDLGELVRETVDDHRAAFDAAGVELQLELPAGAALVDADATRIAQVVTNLLSNALKFTPGGGLVFVGLAARDGVAELSVRDTGAGMAATGEEIERMFEPFAQAAQPFARPLGGLGLGLALVKGLVELHGGAVQARSEGSGRGSEFCVTLPLAAPVAAPAELAAAPVSTGARRILVIEDNDDAGQMLVDLLSLRGHELRLACDGRSGIAVAREFGPDLVICDLGLPDISGYEVARALREDERLRGVTLVALSGYAQPEDRQTALGAGFDEHLPKPAPLERLYELLRTPSLTERVH